MGKDSIKKTALIISSGIINDYSILKKYLDVSDTVICADGGIRHARLTNIIPDIVLGDFDSTCDEDFDYINNNTIKILKHPIEKDKSDTELAIDYAISLGVTDVILTGFSGSRLDHMTSNIFLLKYMHDNNIIGLLVDENNEIRLIDKHITLFKDDVSNMEFSCKVSLLPLTPVVTGVTTKGLSYPLYNATLNMSSTYGISNEFTGDKASVVINEGLLLVFKSIDWILNQWIKSIIS